MYCSKCKKQSPDNFTICAYCGAPLDAAEKKKEKTNNTVYKKSCLPGVKHVVLMLIAFAAVIAVVSVAVGVATSTKPQSALKLLCKATEAGDGEMYMELYDEEFISYEKENKYYSDSSVTEALCEPLEESFAFYGETCGEGFTLKYEVDGLSYISNDELGLLNEVLSNEYGYFKTCSKAAVVDFSVTAKGEKGEYTTVYKNFYCMKISGKWYKAPGEAFAFEGSEER